MYVPVFAHFGKEEDHDKGEDQLGGREHGRHETHDYLLLVLLSSEED